ncbi:MAG: FKBP-type peptidyl-prolyl cis-trans isomerase [Gammaproteobacteria bacterium]|nr:FKBP-type peptidyl-prolyl cis-trans isomerase [Gammaproteobacteria bacterium]
MSNPILSRALAPLLAIALSAPVHAGVSSDQTRYSYTLGYQVAQQLKARGLQVDPTSFADAIEDALAGKPPRLTPEEMQAAIDAVVAQAQEKEQLIADANAKAGADFRAQYAKQDGVKSLDGGLMYRELQAGTGARPTAESTVVVHYRGTLIDGAEFDSSIARGEPATFGIGNVIPGFSQALQNMAVGSKWEVVIPADMAYGAKGVKDGPIGPNETLIFEIELIEIKA